MTEYAQVVSGFVTWVIVADATFINSRLDGPWLLTPSAGSVGIGYQANSTLFAAPLSNLSIATSSELFLSMTAVSSETITYQWQKNGSNIGGATSSTYTIPSVVSGDAGAYTCLVSDGANSLTSTVCTVTVV